MSFGPAWNNIIAGWLEGIRNYTPESTPASQNQPLPESSLSGNSSIPSPPQKDPHPKD